MPPGTVSWVPSSAKTFGDGPTSEVERGKRQSVNAALDLRAAQLPEQKHPRTYDWNKANSLE